VKRDDRETADTACVDAEPAKRTEGLALLHNFQAPPLLPSHSRRSFT